MRKLLGCLLFVPILAQAGTIASMPNKAGGKIVLTNEVCEYKGKTYKNLYRAYNYSSEGYTTEGCYALEDETVVVIWADGSSNSKMRYPVENFTVIKKSGTGYGT